MRETEHSIAVITLVLTMERLIVTIAWLVVMSSHGVSGAAVIHNDTDTFFWATVDMTETLIYSPGNNATHRSNYTANVTMEYFIEADNPNRTLQFTIHEFSLEYFKTDDCQYDRLTIYDGYNESSPILKRLCSNKTAGTNYYTTSDVAFLVFHSDLNNNYPGFIIGVQSYVPPTTTTTYTTTTTTTTQPTPSTSTKLTTTAKPTTTPTPTVTTSRANTDDNNDSTIFIIIGCAVGGLLLLILVILIVICCMKSKKRRPESALSGDSNTKRVLWSRGSTMVQPLDFSKQAVPPGEIVQVKTNLFDLDLPTGHNKANLLPPISSRIP